MLSEIYDCQVYQMDHDINLILPTDSIKATLVATQEVRSNWCVL